MTTRQDPRQRHRVAPDRTWSARLREPGWLLLPLRAFLGMTFCYAGLQKLANPTYLDAAAPTSVQAQMRTFAHTSPIGPLLGLTTHHAGTVGVLIAFGELGVGLGVLLGLWTRIAALGGMLLSVTFLLTVSWNTSPYYYGSDVVFLFAFTPFALAGGGGVLAVDAAVANLARRDMRLSARDGGPGRPLPAAVRRELDRRTLVRGGAAAGVVGAAALVLGGLTAAIGRLAGGTHTAPRAGSPAPAGPPTPAPSAAGPVSSGAPAGTPIAAVGRIPVGHALQFTDPTTHNPAWLVHESPQQFRAFSAICTHAGCTVDYDRAGRQFTCPCHGATYDARTGQVTGGPAPAGLPPITVRDVGGEVRAV